MRTNLVLALAICGFVGRVWSDDTAPNKTAVLPTSVDLQHGEPVLAADKAAVDAPLRRADEHPWIELSHFRRVRLASGMSHLQVDYRIVSGSPTDAYFVFKTTTGRKARVQNLRDATKEATLQLTGLFDPLPDRVELWIECGSRTIHVGDSVVGYKISNSVAIGDVGQFTHPREWKPTELKTYQDRLKPIAPPAPVAPLQPPEGCVLMGSLSLPPGMPVKIFAGNDTWLGAELLGYQADDAVVRRVENPIPGRHAAQVARRNHVAVTKATLEQAEKNPKEFQPSLRLLPNTLSILTDDLTPVTAETPLLPGTPVRVADQWGGWVKSYCLTVPKEGQVHAKNDDFHKQEKDYSIALLAVETAVLKELQQPDAKEVFAKRLDALDAAWVAERRSKAHVRDYLATYPLPLAYSPLGERDRVKKGDRFQAYWGNGWHVVTAVSESAEGAVEINWDDRSANWREFVSRKSLFRVGTAASEDAVAAADIVTNRKKPTGGYRLTLDSAGKRKVAVMKVVMELTGLDLKEAREAIEETPIVLGQALAQEQAEAFLKKIQDAGGRATVKKLD
jgi:large subunit ribosomal protein L7/L12